MNGIVFVCVAQLTGSGKELFPLLVAKAFNNTKTRVTDLSRDIAVKLMQV